jgi:hypothetical protein
MIEVTKLRRVSKKGYYLNQDLLKDSLLEGIPSPERKGLSW